MTIREEVAYINLKTVITGKQVTKDVVICLEDTCEITVTVSAPVGTPAIDFIKAATNKIIDEQVVTGP